MHTYSVFLPFRKGRLALRRKILSLEEAIDCAEAHRAASLGRPGEAFVVVDGTGETLTVAAARDVLARHRQTSQVERLLRARESAARTTERAIQARERAIVACERARTVASRTPASTSFTALLDVDRLIALMDRAAAGMMRSILLMEERLACSVDDGRRAGTSTPERRATSEARGTDRHK